MKHIFSLAFLALLAHGSVASAQMATFDNFDTGINKAGWTYNTGDVIEATGGNPGGYLHQPVADTFAPIFTTTSSKLKGDWRAAGVSRLTFDAILHDMNFGNGSGFEMSILLRDTKGTAGVTDDDYAFYVGPNIPLKGAGWKSFDFAIPSQDTSAVPLGWKGGWAGDGGMFRPGVTWNDVITSVDQVEIFWLNPEFFAIFQQWNVGHDNMAIHASGTTKIRNGAGGNPVGYTSTSAPSILTGWTATVDLLTPGHPLSFVAVSLGGATQGIFPGGSLVGELLLQPNLLMLDLQAGSHFFALPNDPSLLGMGFATQGGTIDAGGMIYFNNAIDIKIGA